MRSAFPTSPIPVFFAGEVSQPRQSPKASCRRTGRFQLQFLRFCHRIFCFLDHLFSLVTDR
ncbi:hypothetical protein GBAR_LOCUS6295 [Geodia barretti]|uniref:Uncharacterized protein n=1 Tax=Geodia barretti TaxID=519541 RepID=A0AA35W5X9_GEOBA|nr:hypothetical protein GBAR_LOCUS6295 [Geodia barretti]